MRTRRTGLAALAVGVLALLGTACQPAPTPQMQLTIALDQAGTYDILTRTVALKVSVTCTRPTTVYVTRADLVVQGSGSIVLSTRSLDSYPSGTFFPVACPGPGGRTETTWWRWTGDAPDTGGYTIWIHGTTFGLLGDPDTAAASGAGTVRFSKVLCWFGLSNPCTPV